MRNIKNTGQKLFAATRVWLLLFLVFSMSFIGLLSQSDKHEVQAATSSTINFQARLLTDTGALVPDGFYNVEFKLYSASSGGTAQWTETYYDSNGGTAGNDNRVRVVNGYLSVYLGSLTPFPSTINWDQEQWLTINIGGTAQTATPTYDGEMSPRLKLSASPYALTAGSLQKTSGANELKLNLATPTADVTYTLQDAAAGNYDICTTATICTGYAAESGSGNYIQNGTSPQTADFNITGTGTVGGILTAGAGGKTAITISDSGAQLSGITIGGDTNIYRLAADRLATDDSLQLTGNAGGYGVKSSAAFWFNGPTSSSLAFAADASGDPVRRFTISANGRMDWGDGTNPVDTNLYRSAANILQSDDAIRSSRVSGSDLAFGALVNGDSVVRLQALADGALWWSDGSSARDTNLYRSAVNTLQTDDTFSAVSGLTTAGNLGVGQTIFFGAGDTNLYRSAANQLTTDDNLNIATAGDDPGEGIGVYLQTSGKINSVRSDAGSAFSASIQGDTQNRLNVTSQGLLQWGDGTLALDTNLYRSGANALRTDDDFHAVGDIGSNEYLWVSANTDDGIYLNHTGATSRKMQIHFQDDGVSTWLLGQDGGGTGNQDFFLYDNVAGETRLSIDSTGDVTFDGDLLPSTDDTFDLGSNTARWKDLYLGGETIHLGDSTSDEATISYNNTTDSLVFKNATDSSVAFQIQNSSGASLFSADTSISQLLSTGSLTVSSGSSGGGNGSTGGIGTGAIFDDGGGGGGGIGGGVPTQDPCGLNGGYTGGQAIDVSGLFAVLTDQGYSTTGPGTGYGCTNPGNNTAHGNPATGFGSGGGGGGWWGGNGGNGLHGGGGGGAAGNSIPTKTGGTGGGGAVVFAPVGASNVVRTTGTSWTVPGGVTSVKVWAVGAGGGGAGSSTSDGESGGGGGAGGVTYRTFSVTPGQSIPYSLGAGGSGGTGATNGDAGGDTTVDVGAVTLRANGGAGGVYNTGTTASGGSFSGQDVIIPFQVQNNSGDSLLSVDATNNIINAKETIRIEGSSSAAAVIRYDNVTTVPSSSDSEGPNDCSLGENDNSIGTVAWDALATDPNDGCIDDGGIVITQLIADLTVTNYLKLTNFGFSIPDGATIDGITVEIKKSDFVNSGTPDIIDNSVRLLDETGTPVGDDKATGTGWPVYASGAEPYTSYGGSSDEWNNSWSPSDINDSDFGFVIAAEQSGSGDIYAIVDSVLITVDYTTATSEETISWTQGVDTDGEFKLSQSSTLSTNNVLTVNSDGNILFQGISDSTDAFQIQNSAGDQLFNLNSTSGQLTLGSITPAAPPSGGGTVGSWSATTSLPAGRFGATSVAHNGYIYEIGGTADGSTAQTTVYYAPLNANGTVGTWNTTTALPSARFNATSIVSNGYVYVMGGTNGSSEQTTVYYAPLNANGTVGTWNTTTALPSGRQLATTGVYNDYVYVVGGGNGGVAQTTVYYAPLNANGTVGTWNTTTVLPAARAGAVGVTNNGYIYVQGGSATPVCATTPTGTTYYAPLNANGTVGTWNTTTTIVNWRFGAAGVAWGGYLHTFQGKNNGSSCGVGAVRSQSFQINANGTLGSQFSPNAPSYGAIQHTVVAYNGYLYTLGGTTNGSNSLTNVEYATISGTQGSVGIDASVGLTINSDSTAALLIQDANADALFTVDTTNGRVGIGTDAPATGLEVNYAGGSVGIMRLRNTNSTAGSHWNIGPDTGNNFIIYNHNNTGVWMANGGTTWNANSDERLKTNIQSLDSSLSKILQLAPITYEWKDVNNPGSLHIGFLAQDVQQLFPELVSSGGTTTIELPDGSKQVIENTLGVDYTSLIVPTIGAIKELNEKVDNIQLQGQNTEFNNLTADVATIDQIYAPNATITNLEVSGTAIIDTLHITGNSIFDGKITLGNALITRGDQPTIEYLESAWKDNHNNTVEENEAKAIVNGNDIAGTITLKTGDNPIAGEMLKFIFNNRYVNPPRVVLSPANSKAADLRVFREDTTAQYFILKSNSAPQPNTTYKYDYFIIQTE